jgi:hypothetical protein
MSIHLKDSCFHKKTYAVRMWIFFAKRFVCPGLEINPATEREHR